MTATHLLSAVLADPFDDAPRLILADWLEENDKPERAEFIRDNIQQCDRCSPHLYDADNTYGIGYHPERDPASGRHEGGWTNCKSCNGGGSGGIRKRFTDHDNEILKKVVYIVRRGFPDEIRCTMREWVGVDPCRQCGGRGSFIDYGPIRSQVIYCLVCRQTGRTPGIAKAVCEQWPVTVVRLTGAEALRGSMFVNGQLRRWVQWSHEVVDSLGMTNSNYHTEQEALAALSHAALTLGRRAAGLPDIQFINHK
jgi:uncharacterized protein (TIGR02996 family)